MLAFSYELFFYICSKSLQLIGFPLGFSSCSSSLLGFFLFSLTLFPLEPDLFFTLSLGLYCLSMDGLSFFKVSYHQIIWLSSYFINREQITTSLLLKPRQHILFYDLNLEPIGEESSISKMSIAMTLHVLDVLLSDLS
jgi:hypothetical protein